MQSTLTKGGLRASAISKASGVNPKCIRFRLVPLIILVCTSVPIALQPIMVASRIVVPVPQNGSNTVLPVFASARLTMQRASLAFIADGWKKGFLRGRRSTKGLGWISAKRKPKTSLWPVRIPKKVFVGFLRLTFVPFVF